MALRKRGEVVEESSAQDQGLGDLIPVKDRMPSVRVEWRGPRTVRVVWGEEKITPPGSYSTVTVGPYEMTFVVPEGDAAGPYLEAAQRDLAETAEVERERKVQSFCNKFQQTARRMKGDS